MRYLDHQYLENLGNRTAGARKRFDRPVGYNAGPVSPLPITTVAERLGIPESVLEPYGKYTAKIRLDLLDRFEKPRGKLVLITAITPTTSGEGKTVTTIGLTQGLVKRGHTAVAALREPSLGPVFGQKGGATGGGKASLHAARQDQPALQRRLPRHHVGPQPSRGADRHALPFRQRARLDPKEILWPRAMDMNDRALRQIATGLGGRTNGPARETGFVITAASEIMAILALSESRADLRRRSGRDCHRIHDRRASPCAQRT